MFFVIGHIQRVGNQFCSVLCSSNLASPNCQTLNPKICITCSSSNVDGMGSDIMHSDVLAMLTSIAEEMILVIACDAFSAIVV